MPGERIEGRCPGRCLGRVSLKGKGELRGLAAHGTATAQAPRYVSFIRVPRSRNATVRVGRSRARSAPLEQGVEKAAASSPPPSAAPQASPVFCQQPFERLIVEHGIGEQLLQAPVLVLQTFERGSRPTAGLDRW